MSNQITCPHCQNSFNLSEIANHEREEWQKSFEVAANEKVKAWQEKKEQELKTQFANEGNKTAKALEDKLITEQKKREEAEKNEMELRKKSDELIEREKNIELEKQRAVDAEKEKIKKSFEDNEKVSREKFLAEKDEEHRRKEMEYQKQLDQMKKTLDDAKRKADQGSMQIQWDIQEDDLRDSLRNAFPIDTIEDVPTGIKWADLIQTVRNTTGKESGIILWESKNTKTWSDDWIQKLKWDMRATTANFSILVTVALPKDVKDFKLIDGVWVTRPEFIIPVTSLIREQLIALNQVRASLVGKDSKMEALYGYLSWDEFRIKMEWIVEAFVSMKSDLDTERRAMERLWKKREKQLEQVITGTSGMYGDLEGIIGNALPHVEQLSLEEWVA